MNRRLFECLLQGIIREMERVYWNFHQKTWGERDSSCTEWWPKGVTDVCIGGFSLTRRECEDGDPWAEISCGGKNITIEISGKRIGMYGPSHDMSDAEMVSWFNASMAKLSEFDISAFRHRISECKDEI